MFQSAKSKLTIFGNKSCTIVLKKKKKLFDLSYFKIDYVIAFCKRQIIGRIPKLSNIVQ